MKRPILIIGAVALLGFGANAAKAQSEPPIWAGFNAEDQPTASLPIWTENQPLEATPLALVPAKTCDAAVAGPSINQTCRRQMKDFKAGMQARSEHRSDAIAFNDGSDEQDGFKLDGLKVKAYHRF